MVHLAIEVFGVIHLVVRAVYLDTEISLTTTFDQKVHLLMILPPLQAALVWRKVDQQSCHIANKSTAVLSNIGKAKALFVFSKYNKTIRDGGSTAPQQARIWQGRVDFGWLDCLEKL